MKFCRRNVSFFFFFKNSETAHASNENHKCFSTEVKASYCGTSYKVGQDQSTHQTQLYTGNTFLSQPSATDLANFSFVQSLWLTIQICL